MLCCGAYLAENATIQNMEANQFAQHLKEAKAWCFSRLLHDANNNLRSPDLKPEHIEIGMGVLDWPSQQRQTVVDELTRKRAQLLKSWEFEQSLDDNGRVLVFIPDHSLFDGAAEVETGGFFDDNNVPAWDTWIDYVEGHLLSWVPSNLVELVEGGIQVNPEECIMWAKDVDILFLRRSAIHPLL